jgi:hypothetical protein
MAREDGMSVQVVATLPLRLEKRRREHAQVGLTQKKLSNSREFLVDYSTPEVMQAIGSD